MTTAESGRVVQSPEEIVSSDHARQVAAWPTVRPTQSTAWSGSSPARRAALSGKKEKPATRAGSYRGSVGYFLRRRAKPRPVRAMPSSANVPGSGTLVTDSTYTTKSLKSLSLAP